MQTKKLAVIGASYLQLPLVKKAKEMGLEVHCFAWAEGAVCKDLVDYFYPISIIEKEEILAVCKKVGIDGICTIASDVAAPTVAYVANMMNLVGNNYEAAIRANNKYQMREAFMKAGVPCPKFMMVTPETIDSSEVIDRFSKFQYPMIIKPSDRSGSLGVTKIIMPSQFYPAVEFAIDKSFKHQAMVEEFIEGREISVEFISYNGVHYPLQITDKITTEAPHFVELEHHQPSTLSTEMFTTIYDVTKTALNALGLTNGASHAEYKITNEGRIAIMEIGGRMGGDFIGSDLVRLSTGYDFVKGVIDVALGEFEKPVKTLSMCSGVYFLCKETEYLKETIEKWENNPFLIEGKITDTELHNVTCSADRSGYAIYQAETKYVLT
ncbi:MAG: ATP-grasp domain-containing protein [Alistipes sp.]|nr:ATP-grasp domain-containing protein [Alistipes sp.]